MIIQNLVKLSRGSLHPLIIEANSLGLMNPSILFHDNKIRVILRNVNYTFYHSEKNLFHHPFGQLTYIHPQNDIKLRTALKAKKGSQVYQTARKIYNRLKDEE